MVIKKNPLGNIGNINSNYTFWVKNANNKITGNFLAKILALA
jgi:hypothetical protein